MRSAPRLVCLRGSRCLCVFACGWVCASRHQMVTIVHACPCVWPLCGVWGVVLWVWSGWARASPEMRAKHKEFCEARAWILEFNIFKQRRFHTNGWGRLRVVSRDRCADVNVVCVLVFWCCTRRCVRSMRASSPHTTGRHVCVHSSWSYYCRQCHFTADVATLLQTSPLYCRHRHFIADVA